jgi:hypothetical protein
MLGRALQRCPVEEASVLLTGGGVPDVLILEPDELDQRPRALRGRLRTAAADAQRLAASRINDRVTLERVTIRQDALRDARSPEVVGRDDRAFGLLAGVGFQVVIALLSRMLDGDAVLHGVHDVSVSAKTLCAVLRGLL